MEGNVKTEERPLGFPGSLVVKNPHANTGDTSLIPDPERSPLSMRFSRQEYWIGCHFLLQGIFWIQESNAGLLHCRQTPALQVDSLPTELQGKQNPMDREAWRGTVHGVARVGHDLVTKPPGRSHMLWSN